MSHGESAVVLTRPHTKSPVTKKSTRTGHETHVSCTTAQHVRDMRVCVPVQVGFCGLPSFPRSNFQDTRIAPAGPGLSQDSLFFGCAEASSGVPAHAVASACDIGFNGLPDGSLFCFPSTSPSRLSPRLCRCRFLCVDKSTAAAHVVAILCCERGSVA